MARHFDRLRRLERLGKRPEPVRVRVILRAEGSPEPEPEPGVTRIRVVMRGNYDADELPESAR